MRVLHVVPTYLPATRYGGPIWSVHGLCRALATKDHDVHVFTTSVDGDGDSDVPLGVPVRLDGVQVWYFPSRWLRRLYWSPPMMAALKAQVAQFDVVHLHSVFLWPTWAAARVACARRVPYILSPRGMLVGDLIRRKSHWLKSAWIRLIERRNLRAGTATQQGQCTSGVLSSADILATQDIYQIRDDHRADTGQAVRCPRSAFVALVTQQRDKG